MALEHIHNDSASNLPPITEPVLALPLQRDGGSENVSPKPGAVEKNLSRTERLRTSAKRTVQLGIVAAEVNLTNEAIRLGIFGAGEALTHNPLVGAATLGLSTLAIESGAAVATASLFDTEGAKKTVTKINQKLRSVNRLTKRAGIDVEANLSPFTKATCIFLGGSVVGMALQQREDPTRTQEQNRNYGLKTSVYLAGACAVMGALGPEAVDTAISNPDTTKYVAATAVGVAVANKARRMVKAAFAPRVEIPDIIRWRDSDKRYDHRFITDEPSLQQAAELEQEVWYEMRYGNLEEEGYTKYMRNSRVFASYEGDRCVGMDRVFRVTEKGELAPFFDLPFYDESEREKLAVEYRNGDIEELGTIAIAPDARHKGVNEHLYRLAYRDARYRGIKKWGIIMEPDRVERMNNRYGFTFKMLGEPINYQGGDCAAHIMDLEEVYQNMKRTHPLKHWWFTKKALRP